MVTVLIAAGIIGGAAVGAGALMKFGKAQSSFSAATGAAFRVESHLISALQAPDTYKGSVGESLRRNESPTGLGIRMQYPDGSVASSFTVGADTKIGFDGKPCVKDCPLTTRLEFKCIAGICRAAYQVEFDQAVVKSAIPPLGANKWPPQANDYTQAISFELFRRLDENSKCAPGELFVSGLDRSTGAVQCVRTTSRRLPASQIAKAVEYSAATGALEFRVQDLRSMVCPEKYVAQRVRPGSMETSPEGTCVYRYKKQLPWMAPWPTGAASVSGRFCPAQDYEAIGTGSCTVQVTSSTNGYCPATCTDAQGASYDCSYSVAPTIAYDIQQSVSGPNVSCSFTKTGSQQCGASWEGQVVWGGNCRITVPETQAGGG